jgi:dihydrofolate synthase/folylpolyglutamate synthase
MQSILSVSVESIRQGIAQAKLQGRFQFFPGEIPVLLDVGHNPQAIQTLLDYLQERLPDVKIHAIFAMMKDKDIATAIHLMSDRISDWYCAPLNNPRAATESLLRTYFAEQNIHAVHGGYDSVVATVEDVKSRAKPGELILVFGSFFLVSEYLAKFA